MKTLKNIFGFAVLFIAFAAKGATVTLTSGTGEVTLQDNDVLTGTGGSETHVTIAAGATVTLRDVAITAISKEWEAGHFWAGITCKGDATIVLQGANAVKGGHEDYPGIFVPMNSTLTIRGYGALDAGSNGYGAGIGGGIYLNCGDIVIRSGVITATGGENFAAGIGGGQESECGSITIAGGTVTATGGQLAPAIGSGAYGLCGDIVIAEGVTCVTLTAGEGGPCSVGAGLSGTCGTVKVAEEEQTYTIDDSPIPGIAASPFFYNPCVTNITSAADWDVFASRVRRGVDPYDGKTVTLLADISVSTMAGMVDSNANTNHPFCGTFEGGGHTLTVSLSGSGIVAPFSAIDGATIRNLNVSGSVNGGSHSAGLVGLCSRNSGRHAISNCVVSVNVAGGEYLGGVVGHGGSGGPLTIENTIFSGTISGFSIGAGGIMGWCDDLTLAFDNCLMKGSFAPGNGGKYHPIACKLGGTYSVAATASGVYYLNTMLPTMPSRNAIDVGEPVSATRVPFEWTDEVTAIDGVTYYKTAPVVTLTDATGLVTLRDGDIIAGTGGTNTHLVVAAGAKVLFRGVNITGIDNLESCSFAGIAFEGDATIVISGVNAVKGGYKTFPGIEIPDGATLTVQGDGSLTADSNGSGPAIVGNVAVGDGLIDVHDGNTRRIMPGINIAETTNNAAAIAQHDGSTEPVLLGGRTLYRDGTYNTLCLPFNMSADQIAASSLAGAIIKRLDNTTSGLIGDTLELDFRDVTEIEAGRPYLVRWPVLIIRSTADWNAFAESVSSGAKSYEGWLVKLAADISVSKMVGVAGCPFRGTFDGCGHTINVSSYSGNALFYELNGATIQNVRVTGNIFSYFYFPATFAAVVAGESTIKSCWSAVNITTKLNIGWMEVGAIVARVNQGVSLYIADCSFTGSVVHDDVGRPFYSRGGGMVGWALANANVYLTRCAFMPVRIQASNYYSSGIGASSSFYFVSSENVRGHLEKCIYNNVAAQSPLKVEGIRDSSIGSQAALLAYLGSGWTVQGSYLVPKMDVPCGIDDTPVEEPFFANMTVSAETDSVEIGLAECVRTIRSAGDWNAFANNVNSGAESYEGWLVRLVADISVTTMVGTQEHPFKGTFDGCGHTLNVNISDGENMGAAPFHVIDGATISNVKTTGTVVGQLHCAGLVGFAQGASSMINNCEVAASVVCSEGEHSHCGGILGHGVTSSSVISNCLFSGSISGATTATGIIYGWGDSGRHTIANCLAAGTYTDCSGIDLVRKYGGSPVVSNCLKTQDEGEWGTYTTETGSALAVMLGDGWKVDGDAVVPKMGAAEANLEVVAAEFVGTTSQVALGVGYRSTLVIAEDGTLAVPSAGSTVNSCRAFFRLKEVPEGSEVTRYVLNFDGSAITGDLDIPSASGYELWAADNGIDGAAAETDAGGVANVFRYAFHKPTGEFADPVLLAIAFEEGQVVIYTPPLVNTEGYTFSIVASDAPGGDDTATYPLDPTGRTVIPAADKTPARFFRLRAVETE